MKKIFALVLSLCMVLSTFVAVSAQEQVWNEGVYNEGVWNEGNETTLLNINKNFDAADSEVLYGAGIAGSQVADPAGERAGMVAGGAISTGSTGYIGVKLPVSGLSTGDTVEISLDIYSSADWKASDAGSTQGVMLRAGDSWAPAGSWVQVIAKDTAVPANTWTTVSNTFTMTKDVSGVGIWMQIRANVVLDYFYIDNLSLTVKGPREVLAAAETDCDDAADGVIEKGASPAAINGVETADGRTYLKTHVGGGSSNFVGFRLKEADGDLYLDTRDGDTFIFTMDINPSVSFTPNTSTQGFLLRQGDGTAFPGTGNLYKQLAPTTAIPANQWTTVTGSFSFTEAWKISRDGKPNMALSLGIRTNAEMDIKIDNVSYKVVRGAEKIEPGWEVEPGWVVEPGWETPSYSTTTVKSASYPFITESNGAFTFTTADVAAKVGSDAWSSQFCLMIKFDQPIARDADFKVVYDLKTSGVLNSIGNPYAEMDVSARAVDNTTDVRLATTIGYIYAKAPVNTEDANTIVLDSANMTANGGTSSSDTIAAICLVINMQGACQGYNKEANDGSVTFSNIAVMNPDSKVALSAAKTANGVDLTLSNANAEKYKFAGRLLVAEYKVVMVDGKEVKELVQFTEVAVDEEIEAGSDAVVTAEFEKDITAGNQVYVFVWEPASFDAITMFTK